MYTHTMCYTSSHNQKEWITNEWNKTDKCWKHYTEWKKSDTRINTVLIYLNRFPEVAKLIHGDRNQISSASGNSVECDMRKHSGVIEMLYILMGELHRCMHLSKLIQLYSWQHMHLAVCKLFPNLKISKKVNIFLPAITR